MYTTEKQVCNKCHKAKPLSQFHRRRNGHQKTCKICRNQIEAERHAQGKQPLPRQTAPVNTSNFIALEKRIVSLESKLRAKAHAFSHDGMDADDIFSAMVEAILTNSQPEESDVYILQRASWTAQAYVAKNLTYSQYVGDLDVDEKEVAKGGFTIVTNPRAIEDAMIEQEDYSYIAELIQTLPEKNRQIVAMLSIGYKQNQIARELKVTEQTVSERIKSIRATLNFQMA